MKFLFQIELRGGRKELSSAFVCATEQSRDLLVRLPVQQTEQKRLSSLKHFLIVWQIFFLLFFDAPSCATATTNTHISSTLSQIVRNCAEQSWKLFIKMENLISSNWGGESFSLISCFSWIIFNFHSPPQKLHFPGSTFSDMMNWIFHTLKHRSLSITAISSSVEHCEY